VPPAGRLWVAEAVCRNIEATGDTAFAGAIAPTSIRRRVVLGNPRWILLWNTLDHVSLALSLGGEIRGSGDGDRKLNLECAYVIWFMHICPFEAGVDHF
jgi:hypothetical protein